MLGTDIRGIMAEEEEVQRRQEALQSLMSMRERLLKGVAGGANQARTWNRGLDQLVAGRMCQYLQRRTRPFASSARTTEGRARPYPRETVGSQAGQSAGAAYPRGGSCFR